MRLSTFGIIFILLALVLVASGCASKPQIEKPPQIVEIKIPVAVPCINELPPKPPIHSNDLLLSMTDYAFVTALHGDRLALDLYSQRLENILAACK